MRATEKNDAYKEGIMTIHRLIGSYRPEIYATDNVIAGTEADIVNYKQPKKCPLFTT